MFVVNLRDMKSFSLLSTLLTLFILNSCAIVSIKAKKYISVEKTSIPPEFGNNDKEILLIKLIEKAPKLNFFVKSKFNIHYKGKKAFAPIGADIETAYDKTIYRYVFVVEKFTKIPERGDAISTARYFVLDRKRNKKYKCWLTSSFYGQVARAYAKNLEKERQLKQAEK